MANTIKNGKFSFSLSGRGEGSVWLTKPAYVERGSGHVAELAILVDNVETSMRLTKVELQLLADRCNEFLQGKQ